MNLKHVTSVAIASLLTLGLATGCTENKPEETTTPTPEETTTPTPAETTTPTPEASGAGEKGEKTPAAGEKGEKTPETKASPSP